MKRLIAALSVSLAIFITGGAFYVFSLDPRPAFKVDENAPSTLVSREEGGISYQGDGLYVPYYTKTVKKGKKATVEVVASPEENVSISVYYPSGKSSSSALNDKAADVYGKAVFDFTIPATTQAEQIRVVIRTENARATLYIDII